MMRLFPLVAVLLLSVSAFAADLTPELVAKIKDEQQTAEQKVNKEYGNKKSSELSGDERKEIIQKTAAADEGVLAKHGVSDKDYARYVATMSLEDRKREQAEAKKLKEAKEKEAAKGKDAKSQENH
jgi:hypothetical protein